MKSELIKDKVYYKIFDRTFTASSGFYNKHKYKDAAKLAEVEQNVAAIKTDLGAQNLPLLKQVHGIDVVYINGHNLEEIHEADGCITDKPGIALGIVTADCVPVLMASDDGAVIGSVHCGWKSARGGIIKEISKQMKEKGAGHIKAVIGPAIAQESYEVDSDFYKDFTKDDPSCKSLFTQSKNTGHYMFDLIGYVKNKLSRENIELVAHIDDDTYSMPEKYPSRRRSFHAGEQYAQNILSTIMIK